jgi:predicted TIM-barrel fold metal-dependent hydrolase
LGYPTTTEGAVNIIDSHITLAPADDPLPGFRRFHPSEAIARLDEHVQVNGEPTRVDRALVTAPPIDPRHENDLLAHHAWLVEAVEQSAGRLIGCVTAHPTIDPAGCAAAVRRLIEDHGFRAIALEPVSHRYLPNRVLDTLRSIVDEAIALDVPIFVASGDPPFGVPSLLGDLVESRPRACFVVRNIGTRSVSYAKEAIYLARRNSNVFLETGWAQMPRIAEAIAAIGPRRLVFGSDLPYQDLAPAVAAVTSLRRQPPIGCGLSADEVLDMLGANLAALLRLG